MDSDAITTFLQELKAHWERNNIPNVSLKNALFLREIIAKNTCKKILEIGSANGYSTIHFALEIQKNEWKITSIEFSQLAYEEAQDNYEAVWLSQYITHYFGDAREVLPLLDEKYDFIFIDGLKKESLNFLKLVWDKTLPNAIIVIDDVIKFRYKMESLYEYLNTENIAYEVIQIDDDDGIMIIKK